MNKRIRTLRIPDEMRGIPLEVLVERIKINAIQPTFTELKLMRLLYVCGFTKDEVEGE